MRCAQHYRIPGSHLDAEITPGSWHWLQIKFLAIIFSQCNKRESDPGREKGYAIQTVQRALSELAIRDTKTRVSRLSGLFWVGVGKTDFGWRGLPKALFSHTKFCPMKTVSDSEEPSMYTQSYRHRNLCHYHQSLLTLCTGEAHGRKYHTGNIPKRGITASSLHTSSFQTKCRGSRAISVVVKAGEASLGG